MCQPVLQYAAETPKVQLPETYAGNSDILCSCTADLAPEFSETYAGTSAELWQSIMKRNTVPIRAEPD